MFSRYKKAEDILNKGNVGLYTFYRSNVSVDVIQKQKCVFSKFSLNINQILDDNLSHGEFLNKILNETSGPEYIIFFDIDCVVLNKNAVLKLVNQISDKRTLAGAAQTANHFLGGKNLYVGPFFMGISKELYTNLGCPDMCEGKFWDVAAMLTMAARFQGETRIKFWFPSKIEIPKWKLYNNGMFGIGTTYEKMVFHAFESRLGESENLFISKCNSILS